MKQQQQKRRATALLITGLLMATLMPALFRHYSLPDYIRGFVMGLGIGLEITALVMFVKIKKAKMCGL